MLSSSVRHTVSRVADKMLSLLVELLGIFRISGYLHIDKHKWFHGVVHLFSVSRLSLFT